jgi:penicillin-binding protein 1A
VTKPSKVVKPGDIVEVKILSKNKAPWYYLSKNFKKRIKDKEIIRGLKNQKFFLAELDQKPTAQVALLSIDPHTGNIISMVGGNDFSKSQFNRALQSNRQPGSSFKPFLYAAGLENGYTPSSIILDSPEALGGVSSELNWKPKNYDGKFKGPMTFRKALQDSRNVPTIKIAAKLGVKRIKKFLERIKFNANIDDDLSLALGSFGITLKDLVTAYSIFPNGGIPVQTRSITSVVDRNGEVLDINLFK